jgi:hypothetical protein
MLEDPKDILKKAAGPADEAKGAAGQAVNAAVERDRPQPNRLPTASKA